MPRATTAKSTESAEKPAKKATAKKASKSSPDYDAIAKRAYELFLARGGQHGYHIEDWLQAERDTAA